LQRGKVALQPLADRLIMAASWAFVLAPLKETVTGKMQGGLR
jgi:hypothetical protein